MSKTRLGDGQRQSTQPNYNTAASTSVRTELALTGSFALRPDQLVNGRTNGGTGLPHQNIWKILQRSNRGSLSRCFDETAGGIDLRPH